MKPIKLMILGILLLSFLSSCKIKKHIVRPDGKTAYQLFFEDNFDKTALNAQSWVYRTDSKHWSTQLPINVMVSDGFLNLKVKKEKSLDKDYTGAGIISIQAFSFGFYEASMKIPKGAGWHNSFWLMTHDGSGGTGPKQSALELDICENDSKNQFGYNANVHRWQDPHIQRGTKWIKTPNLSEGFHKWGCEYTKNEVKYYFDDVLVQTIDIKDLPHKPMHIWLTTIASYHGNTTKVDDTRLPDQFMIDYVRYYKPVEQ